MKTKMISTGIRAMMLLFVLSIFSEAIAQPALRIKSRRVIRRTAVVLLEAHKSMKANHVYTGNFARAVAHQRLAKRLHVRKMFVRAIHHSRRARMLAMNVIRANKHAVAADWEFDKEETEMMKDAPDDQSLDKELEKESPNTNYKDEDWLDKNLNDIDLDDMSDK